MGRPHQAMPTRRELQIHNEVFFAEILSRVAEGKRPRLRPRGSSMRPFIRGGQDQIVPTQTQSCV